MSKKVLALILTLGMVLTLAACGEKAVAPTEKRVLTFANHNSKESTNGQQSMAFVDYVNENSSTIEIDPYFNGELGGIQEALEGVAMGTIDITGTMFAQLAGMYAPMEVFSMPYLVKNGEDNKKLMDRENNQVLDEMLNEFEKNSSIVVFGTSSSYDARQLTCNFEVKSPADLSGVKIRSITNDVYTMTIEGLGGTPVPIDWTETMTALTTGTVQGQENPYATLVSYQLWDSQKYIMETNHIYDSAVHIINADLWNSLTDEEKQVLKDGAVAMEEFSHNLQIDNAEEYRKTCEENGMTIITEADGLDVDAFKANTDKLKSERYPEYQEYFDRINEYLGY